MFQRIIFWFIRTSYYGSSELGARFFRPRCVAAEPLGSSLANTTRALWRLTPSLQYSAATWLRTVYLAMPSPSAIRRPFRHSD